MRKLKDMVEISISPATNIDDKGDVKVLRASDISSNGLIDYDSISSGSVKSNKSSEKQFLKKGDVVFQSKGSRFEATVINKEYEKLLTSQIYFNLRIKHEEYITPEYLAWYLNSRIAHTYFEANSSGATIKAVTKKTLAELVVEIPGTNQEMDTVTDLISSFASEKSKTQEYLLNKELLVNESIIKSFQKGDK